MKGEFIIILDGKLKTYENYEDVPLSFDNLIKFEPCYVCGPHTQEEHDELDTYTEKLQELMKRETM